MHSKESEDLLKSSWLWGRNQHEEELDVHRAIGKRKMNSDDTGMGIIGIAPVSGSHLVDLHRKLDQIGHKVEFHISPKNRQEELDLRANSFFNLGRLDWVLFPQDIGHSKRQRRVQRQFFPFEFWRNAEGLNGDWRLGGNMSEVSFQNGSPCKVGVDQKDPRGSEHNFIQKGNNT